MVEKIVDKSNSINHDIFITGGNGFIGLHIVEEFVKQKIGITCLVRSKSNNKELEKLPIKLLYSDLLDDDLLNHDISNCKMIIHVAALVNDWNKKSDFYSINLQGTINILNLAKKNGIKKLVIISTNSIYGEEHNLLLKNELSPQNSHYNYFLDKIFPCRLNYYRDSKKEAINQAVDFCQNNNIDLFIIEPGWVFGEREYNTIFYEIFNFLKMKLPFAVFGKKNKLFVTYVKDISNLIFKIYQKFPQGINNFLLGYEPTPKLSRIIDLYCLALKRKKPYPIPLFLIYPIAFLFELFYTIFNIAHAPLLTRGRVKLLYDNIECSTKKIKDALNYEPMYNVEEAILKTINWYRKSKKL